MGILAGRSALLFAMLSLGAGCAGMDPGGAMPDGTPPSTAKDPPNVAPPAPAGQPITAADHKWTWVPIDGTACMDGSGTGIGINPSQTSDKVLIVLEGGGACFNDATCTVGTINANGFDASTFAVEIAAMGYSGILNRNLPNNPFADWSYVFVPYCTGDIHGGNNPNGPSGRHHVGYANITLDLQRIVPTFPNAREVVLAGSSAGGVGAAYNFDQVQQAFGHAPVVLLDDSGPVFADQYLKPCLQEQFRQSWNLDATLPADCADCRESNGGGLINLPKYLAMKYPDRRFGMISSTGDAVMSTFFGFGYSSDCKSPGYVPPADFAAGLDGLRTEGEQVTNSFHVFYPQSTMHTWLLTDVQLATMQSDVVLADWVRDLANGSASWSDVP